MRTNRFLAFVLATALAALGCVSSGDVELLHREITDVGKRVDDLARATSGKEDVAALSRTVSQQTSQLLKSNADIQQELRALREQMETLQAALEATNQRLGQLSQELAAAREKLQATSAPSVPSPAPQPSEPAQLYNSAYEDYMRGNYDLAIQGFSDYLRRYPDTELADNALYWIGECYYSKKDFDKAIDAFTQLLNTYKTSDKAAAALLKKGFALQEKGDRSQAVINLQYVIFEYPASPEAGLAKERLAKLGVKIK
ncbi:MAG: tol-pal system protein YbgF [Thermoanaerobaculum sp.]|nr:tol-pal system protein YbgF [Thermoanaerobaculum sp.]MCX7895186.1 tol-pal system protein YbgF [Thermoanaerobaculum sp.]MDW7966516.1 tol-pal system protein YbgF [Thermoanaerobaculum sp.]